jgi:putative acetyltransferase
MTASTEHGDEPRRAAVVLRPITADDDPVMARIVRAVMIEHGANGPGFAIDDPEVDALSRAYDPSGEPPAEYWVLDDAGEVVGGAGFAALAGGDGQTCELRKMYLLPRARGGGHGRRLLEHVLARAAATGYRRCYLETLATMDKARALYLAAGFTKLCRPEGATGHFACDAWYTREL